MFTGAGNRSRQALAPLLIIVAIALLVRMGAISRYGVSTVRFGDAPDYLSAASSLCTSGSYPDRGDTVPFLRAPGLPFFIAAATLCHVQAIGWIKAALAAVDALSVALVFLLSEEIFGEWRYSLLAAFLAAINPFFISQITDVRTEALFMFFFLAGTWLAVRSVRDSRASALLCAGLCAGAAALVRPIGLVLVLLLPAAIVFLRMPKWPENIRLLAAFLMGVLLCIGPWVIRNELHYHELILINDAGGYAFWRGTSPELDHVLEIRNPRAFAEASLQFETVTSPTIARQINRQATTPAARSRAWYRLAFSNLAMEPAAFAARLLRNAAMYWRPWLSAQTYSDWVVVASGVLMASLDLLALFGWNELRQRSPRLALWCAASAAAFWLLQAPFQMTSRIRIPIADPFLIIFAAAALRALKGIRRGGGRRIGENVHGDH